jgi:carboxyl-terminal processing protease
MDDMKPLGEIKLTNQKFYRINGGSTQLKGVQSDIVLPDTYSMVDYGEKEYDYALPWTQIDPLDYSQDVFKVNNIQSLASKSAARVSDNAKFGLVEEQALLVKKYRDQSEITLNLEDYRAYLSAREMESKEFEEVMDKDVESLAIKNLAVDSEVFKTDEAKAERNTEWVKSIQKDFYLEETLNILKDLIEENS